MACPMDDEPIYRDPPKAPTLAAALDTEGAFRFLLAQCCAELDQQIAQFLESDDPVGAHKTRVALRRLTTILDSFQGILKRKAYAAERARAKAIFRAIGKVREADVYLDLRGQDASRKARATAQAKAQKLRDTVRRKLRKDGMVGITPALLGKVADGSLFKGKDRGLAARARPLAETAAEALDGYRDACLTFPADLSRLTGERLHDLRKALKGWRYASEFFAPVWQPAEWPALRDLMRKVQDDLGRLNDLAAARMQDGQSDPRAEAEALRRATAVWAALRDAPRWWAQTGQ